VRQSLRKHGGLRDKAWMTATAFGVGTAMLLSACGGTAEEDESAPAEAGAEPEAEGSEPIEVEDNFGTHTLTPPLESVVATDNRTFHTLDDWGVELSAAAVSLMPPGLSYVEDSSITDLGSHREPDLEAVVAAEPDLIINGQRFAQYKEDFEKLAPEAVILELDPRDGEDYADELIRQTEVLGEVFGHEDEAAELVSEFEDSIERAKDAYDSSETVMGVITSGGSINYSAPGSGRALGPIFDVLDLTPALEVDQSSTDHQGDDISVEAIADSNPDWVLVMDRDAALGENSGEEYTPANELIAESAALQNVTAVTEEQIVYMPQYTYLDEGIQTYTEFFNSFADALESK